MRGGTGRLPGQDNEWDPGLYKFLLYLSPDVYMDTGRFSSPSRESGIPVCATGIPPPPGRFLPSMSSTFEFTIRVNS